MWSPACTCLVATVLCQLKGSVGSSVCKLCCHSTLSAIKGSVALSVCKLCCHSTNGEIDWLWEKVCVVRQCGPPVGCLNIGSSLLSRLHALPSTFWYKLKPRNGRCSTMSNFRHKTKHVWIQTTQHYCWTCLATIVLHVIFVNGASYWKVLVVQVCFASFNFMMPVCCGVKPSAGSLASEQGQHCMRAAGRWSQH